MNGRFSLIYTVALCLTFTQTGRCGPTLEEHERRLSVIEAKLGIGLAQPATRPTAKPDPASKPATLPVVRTKGMRLTASFDGGFRRYELEKGAQIVVAGGRFFNAIVAGIPFTNENIVVDGNSVTLDNIAFAPDTGSCIKVSGRDVTIRNFLASTFTGYAVYAERAKNLTIDGFYVAGGSSNESILRFDEASGTVRNFDINYTTASRKATVRGSFVGLIENGTVKGAAIGVNPLDNADGGELLGWVKFAGKFPGGTADAANPQECARAIRAEIARGVKDNVELCRVALKVARDKNGKLIAGDAEATMKRRATDLAMHSDVTFRNVTLENAPLRWAAGTRYDYQGGKLIGASIFHRTDKPTNVYPRPEYVLPGDVVRTAPAISFTGTAFESAQPVAEFLEEVKRYGVKLERCTYNGGPLASGAVAVPHTLR